MKNTVILILPKIIICLADLEVVRVRMPFTPESPKLPPFWFYDNTTDTVTGLYRDLLDAVFSSANLTYNLTGVTDMDGYRAKGYNSLGGTLLEVTMALLLIMLIQLMNWRMENMTS